MCMAQKEAGLRPSSAFFCGPQRGIYKHIPGSMKRKSEAFLWLSLRIAPTFPSVPGAAFRGLDLHQPSWRHELGGATAQSALAQVRAPLGVCEEQLPTLAS